LKSFCVNELTGRLLRSTTRTFKVTSSVSTLITSSSSGVGVAVAEIFGADEAGIAAFPGLGVTVGFGVGETVWRGRVALGAD